MKNHTTTAMLLTLGATMAFVSCTNIADIDILDIGSEQRTWKQELSDIISENAQVLQNSGLTLKSYRNLGNATFDASEFFEESTSQYPVYTGSLDKFTLMPYSFVAEDTVTMHFKMDHLKKHVAETLADRHCSAVLLTWEKDGQTFQTTALFNTETGELEYDNILFNLITAEVRSSEDAPRLLTAAEGSGSYGIRNDMDIVHFISPTGIDLGYAWLSWNEYGSISQKPDTIYNQYGQAVRLRYQYHHDRVEYSFDHWESGHYTGIISLHDFADYSSDNYGLFKYYIWIGPDSRRPSNPMNMLISPGQTIDLGTNQAYGWTNFTMQGLLRMEMIDLSYETIIR